MENSQTEQHPLWYLYLGKKMLFSLTPWMMSILLFYTTTSQYLKCWGILSTNQFWQHFSHSWLWASWKTADLYAAQLGICFATLSCTTEGKREVSPLPYPPYALNHQTMEFSIRKKECSTRRGKISFFVLLLLSSITQSFAPPPGKL